jgi:hypothetical protein
MKSGKMYPYRLAVSVFGMVLTAVCYSAGPVLFSDDFQAYDVEEPADFSIGGIPTGTWSVDYDPAVSRATEIFNTGNFGGTRLWVSIDDGASITSRAMKDSRATGLCVFSAILVAETTSASRRYWYRTIY